MAFVSASPPRARVRRTTADTDGAVPPRGRASRRDSLFEAARRVLAQKNIYDATVDDIVREAGVARGTFYIYFSDKYDLLKELTELAVEEHAVGVELTRQQYEDRFEKLRQGNVTALQFWQKHAPVYRSVFQLAMIREDFHELREKLQLPLRRANADSFRKDQEAGRGRPDVDAAVAAAAMNRTYELIVMEWFGWSSPPYPGATIEGVADELAHLWYHALYPDDATPPSSLVAPNGKIPGDGQGK